jgi:hypothetical protein
MVVANIGMSVSLSDLGYYHMKYQYEVDNNIEVDLLSKISIKKPADKFMGLVSFADSLETVSDDFEESLERKNAVFFRSVDSLGKTKDLVFPEKILRSPQNLWQSSIILAEATKEQTDKKDCADNTGSSRLTVEWINLSVNVLDETCEIIKSLSLSKLPTLVSLSNLKDGFIAVLVKYANLDQFRRRTIASDEVFVLDQAGNLDFSFSIENRYYSPRSDVFLGNLARTKEGNKASSHKDQISLKSTFKKILFGDKTSKNERKI